MYKRDGMAPSKSGQDERLNGSRRVAADLPATRDPQLLLLTKKSAGWNAGNSAKEKKGLPLIGASHYGLYHQKVNSC